MRWIKTRIVDAFGTVAVLSAVAATTLLIAGLALNWANKHALVPAAYASAALAAAPAAMTAGRSTLKSTTRQAQQRHKSRERLLVSPGQHRKPLLVKRVNPAHLRIHPAEQIDQRNAEVPYVKRDLHDRLVRLIGAGTFVLLQGDSAAGKSRLAFEAARAAVPDWTMIVPDLPAITPGALADLSDLAPSRALIWLDDLHRYLTPDGLTERILDRLVSSERQVTILATLNSGAKAALGRAPSGDTDRTLRVEALRIVERGEQQGVFYIDPHLSPTELARAARLRAQDHRVADGMAQNAEDGFGPRLAGGPAALARWQDGRNGGNRIGAAIIDAAVNLRLVGLTAPIPAATLQRLCREHLPPRYRGFDQHTFDAALSWTCESERGTRTCLDSLGHSHYEVFDYLTDHAQRHPGHLPAIPPALWQAAIDTATGSERLTVAAAAFERNLPTLAEQVLAKGAASSTAALYGLAVVVSTYPERHEEARLLYLAALDKGYTRASYSLAVLLSKNPATRDEAVQLYRIAIDAGHTEAMTNLAVLLGEEPATRDEAIRLYRTAIDAGRPEASYNLAALLEKDPATVDEAVRLYRTAIDAGDINAMNNLAIILNKNPATRHEAEQLYRAAVDAGHAVALYNLATLLSESPTTRDEAIELYRLAIDAGDTTAMNGLAALLCKDPAMHNEAEQLLRVAIASGDANAANNLAILLVRDLATRDEAVQLFHAAVDAGVVGASYNLALLREMDPAARDEAIRLYRTDVDAGHIPAMVNLAVLLEARPETRDEAEQLFRAALAAGHSGAMYNLATLLDEDPATRDEAIELYRAAVDTGNADAMNNLAVLLAGDPRSREEAEQLFRAAIDAGKASASYNLALLLRQGSESEGECQP